MRMKTSLPFVLVGLLPLMLGACAGTGPHREAIRPASGGSALFSPIVRTGDLLFLSGVIGRSPDGDIGAATRQSLDAIQGQLENAGASMADIVRCGVFLVDIDDYAGMNEVYVTYFPTDPPARTALAVQALPAGAIVEIECVAAAP